MFLMVEAIIGFSVIMLLLSFLVKSLTSVVKNHVNYYADNLQTEVEHFLRGTLKGRFEQIEELKDKEGNQLLDKIPWRRLGEEFLSPKNMKEVLLKLTGRTDFENLEERVERHRANLKFAFGTRMKNLSLVCGMALCLLMNINALTIWKTLYSDSQTRAKFASPDYVDNVSQRYQDLEAQVEAAPPADRAALAKERDRLKEEIDSFRADVTFGVGAIWGDLSGVGNRVSFLLVELFGSLLTGVLVSIGAPYWHDLLRTMVSIRQGKAIAAAAQGGKKPEAA